MIPKGGLTTWSNGIKVRYYHLHIDNKRPHAPARRVKVMIWQYYIHGPHGKFIRDANHIPVQLQYEFPNLPNHDPRPTIGSATLCDIGFVTERDAENSQQYEKIFKDGHHAGGEHFVQGIDIRGDARDQAPDRIPVIKSDVHALQMAKNFVITDISDQAREQ